MTSETEFVWVQISWEPVAASALLREILSEAMKNTVLGKCKEDAHHLNVLFQRLDVVEYTHSTGVGGFSRGEM